MANQNNPANAGQGNQNRNRPNNNRPPAPKLELKVNHEIFPDGGNNTVDIAIEIYAFFGGHPLTGCQVYLKEGVTELFAAQTTATGKAVLMTSIPMLAEEKIHNYRICLDGYQEEGLVTVKISAVPKVDDPKVDNDPELLILRSHHDGCGNFSVMVRVLKDRGYGLSLPVTIWYEGRAYTVHTDDQGETVFSVPQILLPGESREVVATVSGIEEASRLRLNFRERMAQPYEKYSRDWFFGTNNGRAMILACAFLLSLILALTFTGLNSSLLNKQTFRDDSGLSKQESIYNRTIGLVATKAKIKPVANIADSNLAPGFWKLTGILLLILVIYGPLAWREEIKEAIVESAESIFDRTTTKSSDPTWEHLAKFLGNFHVARRHSTIKVSDSTNSSSSGSPVDREHGHHSWVNFFTASMITEVVFELIPKIFRKIFTK